MTHTFLVQRTLRKMHLLLFAVRRHRHPFVENFSDYIDKYLLFKRLRRLLPAEGDIVECGIGRGITLQMLAYLNPQRTLWAFDSFIGFPKPNNEPASKRRPAEGEWNDANENRAAEMVQAVSPYLELRIRKGFFQDTMREYEGDGIALLHLDCDLYESYKVCLEQLFPKVVSGGIVVFDEYGDPNWPGATKAIDDYFAGIPHRLQKDPLSSKQYIQKQAVF